MPRCLSGPRSLRPLSPNRVRGREGLGAISGEACIPEKGPTALPSSIPAQLLALRSRCAPRRPLTCPAEDGPASFAGFGGPAWTGERRRPRLVAAVELPGGHLCSRPWVTAAAAASAPRTAPALSLPLPPAPPGVVPGAPHPGPAPPPPRSPQPGPRRLCADLGEQPGGSLSSPPPAAAAASLSPPCFVLPSTLLNQPTRRSGPSSGAGRGGAEREAGGAQRRRRSEGREAGLGFSGFWNPVPSLSPSLHPAPVLPQKRCVVLRLLEAFLELLGAQALSFNINMP